MHTTRPKNFPCLPGLPGRFGEATLWHALQGNALSLPRPKGRGVPRNLVIFLTVDGFSGGSVLRIYTIPERPSLPTQGASLCIASLDRTLTACSSD